MILFLGGERAGMLKVAEVVTGLREGENCQFIGIRELISFFIHLFLISTRSNFNITILYIFYSKT